MAVQPQYFGLQGFAFPTVPATLCDYPAEDDVREDVIYADGAMVGTLRGFVGDPNLPASLDHSPADIVRALLILKGVGSPPSFSQEWPIYAAGEPGRPDEIITVFDTTGMEDGRSMIDGEIHTHFGFMVRVRGRDHDSAWTKAIEIRALLSEGVRHDTVVIAGTSYFIYNITRIGAVLTMGKESPSSKRSLCTLNAFLVVRTPE